MKFNLKRPCENCPFLKEGAIDLMPGRIEGIMADIAADDNIHFPCHKTSHQRREPSACIGATVWQRKQACLSVGARVALAVDILTIEQLDNLAVEVLDDPIPANKPRRRRSRLSIPKWKVTMPRIKPAKGKVNFVAAIRRSDGTRMELNNDATNEAHALQAWKLMHMPPQKRDELNTVLLRLLADARSEFTNAELELVSGFIETIPATPKDEP